MSLLAYWATVADQAILSLCIQIMLTWIVLRALKSSSAGFCRDRLCKIRPSTAPRSAFRRGRAHSAARIWQRRRPDPDTPRAIRLSDRSKDDAVASSPGRWGQGHRSRESKFVGELSRFH